MRLAVMVGESIDANVRLRLTANRTYEIWLTLTDRWFALLIEVRAISI